VVFDATSITAILGGLILFGGIAFLGTKAGFRKMAAAMVDRDQAITEKSQTIAGQALTNADHAIQMIRQDLEATKAAWERDRTDNKEKDRRYQDQIEKLTAHVVTCDATSAAQQKEIDELKLNSRDREIGLLAGLHGKTDALSSDMRAVRGDVELIRTKVCV
jgi:hypothetical protein